MRFGGPVSVETNDPVELAVAHAELGYRAAFCPWGLSVADTAYLHALRDAFRERDVVLAEVIGWRNPIPRDQAMRREASVWLTEQLAVADELEARCCLTFGGTLDNDRSWTVNPENLSHDTFDLIVETVRKLIDEVRPCRTKLCLEMMASVFPDSPDSYLELIRAVDRAAFGVHLDPINLILSREQYFDPASVVRACVRKLGPHVVSCHAKDILWRPERGYHLYETIPGTGALDFHTYLSELRQLPGDIPLMLEHLDSPEEYRQGYEYIRSVEAELVASEQ